MPDTRKETNRSGRQLTEKELAARRANARKSTGPRTAEGKARSSQNARRHGLFAQTALLDSESPEDFVALRDAYLAEFDPQGPAETHLVMEMANAQWRLRRVRGIEADLIDHIIGAELDSWRFPPAGARPRPSAASPTPATSSPFSSATKPCSAASMSAPCASSGSTATAFSHPRRPARADSAPYAPRPRPLAHPGTSPPWTCLWIRPPIRPFRPSRSPSLLLSSRTALQPRFPGE